MQELRSAFSNKLLLLFSIFWLYDMDNKVKHLFLEKRVKELMKLVDFVVFETHAPPTSNNCTTFLPNSFSISSKAETSVASFKMVCA